MHPRSLIMKLFSSHMVISKSDDTTQMFSFKDKADLYQTCEKLILVSKVRGSATNI